MMPSELRSEFRSLVIRPRIEEIKPGVGAAVADPASRAAERTPETRMVDRIRNVNVRREKVLVSG